MSNIVFLDVDGTLIDYEAKLPASAAKAVDQARANGHKVYICTGCSKAEILQRNLCDLDGMIGGNGAYVEDNGHVVMHQGLSKEDVKNIVDFGTNNAAIPLLLSKRTPKKIIGIEIQDEAVDLARRNVEMNDLNDQIEVVHGDIKDVIKELPKAQLIVCNPPFFKVGENSNLNDNEYLTIARHEIKIDLEGIISAAAYLLDNKGRFAIVHRPDRMIDILNIMQKYDIEPKRIRFVYPKMNRDSHVLLVEGMYKGKKGLKIEPPLYAHNDDGSYSNEVRRMFGEKIDE